MSLSSLKITWFYTEIHTRTHFPINLLYPYTYAATVDVQSGSFLKSEFRIEKLQLFKKLVSLVCK